jgi:dolichyl-phosphate-mannose--protein O-mannosyl transferase
MHFAQTRLSTIDSYATLFILLMYMLMLDSFTNRIDARPLKSTLPPLLLCGLAFGFGASTKWIVLYAAAGVAFLFFVARAEEIYGLAANSASRRGNPREPYLRRLALVLCLCMLFFVLIPAIVYSLAYIPYTKAPGASGGLFKTVLDSQASMFDYHSTLKDTHPFESSWWSWPIMVKPIWYYSASGLDAGMKASVASFGNPLVWWVGIPCLIASLFIAFKKKDRRMALVFAGFIFQYCPWMFIARATFIYHYFSAVPFVIFCIVYVIKDLTDGRVLPKKAVVVYLGAAALLFALYYPVLSGLPVTQAYADRLRVFSAWYW